MQSNLLHYRPDTPLFDGLVIGNTYPTDIDLAFDFGKAILMVEFKRQGVALKDGQRILLEKLAKNSRLLILPCVAHYIPNDTGTFHAASAWISQIYIGAKDMQWLNIEPYRLTVGDLFSVINAIILNEYPTTEAVSSRVIEFVQTIVGDA